MAIPCFQAILQAFFFEGFALLGALLWFFFGLVWIRHISPKPWFFAQDLTEDGQGLIHFLLGDSIPSGHCLYEDWRRIKRQERLVGVDSASEFRSLLDHWIQIADQNVCLAKESFVVRLPLFELIFLGVGMSLQLCLPGLHYFSLAETLLAVSLKGL